MGGTLRSSAEFKTSRLNLHAAVSKKALLVKDEARKNTPRAFERIYAGRQKAKQNELYRVDALTQLRKEQYMKTLKHDF
eukprot:CAMPEP_0170458602 /NCGR_PEP_ID=MMETSP0123-20130129/5521_1 /TAXON_ID=182087 /ORGANISM="Favella ehrenbergii, Strain Fehren 1" /LENGTH=78 /DNA_ID=CAMNT_0010722813 /DNA_START=1165 /DNA_END=1401 /DNA_ORIENTATION=-